MEVGEPLMVVESDKADMDVEAFEAGYLALVITEEGGTCEVGGAVGLIVENEEDIAKVQSSAVAAPSSVVTPDAPAPEAAASPAPAAPVSKPNFLEVFMPALSSTMTEGKVVQWLKNEGDTIESGEFIMVVESDKADMDVESFESGILAHINVDAGEKCPVGDAVAYIARNDDEVASIKSWVASQSNSAAAAPVTSSATEASTAVAAPAAPSPTSSPPTGAVVNEGRIVASPLAKATAKKMGVDLKYVKGTGPNGRIIERDVKNAQSSGAAPAQAPAYKSSSDKIVATPDAKKAAKKEKIDLGTVQGTGNFGRITVNDVLRAAGKAPVEAQPAAPVAVPTVATSAPAAASQTTKKTEAAPVPSGAVAMNAMQQAVVRNMNASLAVPVFRLTYKIKTTELDTLYAKVKPNGVTISALLAKAVGLTLAKHPIMNAAYGDNSIVYREDINVAMAVALPDGGLMTPTLKNADKTDLHSLSRTWRDLVKRSKQKKLSPDEYNSGTFFVSNLGMFGVEQFDAILPPGAPGILAIGSSKPVVSMQDNGLIGVQKEMSVTLTADHRHIYGADGALFLKDLAALLEGDVTELLL